MQIIRVIRVAVQEFVCACVCVYMHAASTVLIQQHLTGADLFSTCGCTFQRVNSLTCTLAQMLPVLVCSSALHILPRPVNGLSGYMTNTSNKVFNDAVQMFSIMFPSGTS